MLKQLNAENTQKRLGDGYYEQRLLNEQIARLTGKSRLDDYASTEEEYKALMDAGLTAAKKFNLTVGVALTDAQMAQLTSDIVWLVNERVTLPDGSTTTALVPQVYVRANKGDIDGSGTLIAAKRTQIQTTGDINNSGTIAGFSSADLGAKNLNNLGGTIQGNRVAIKAENDINNIGGQISAKQLLALQAGNDINSITTTSVNKNVWGKNGKSHSSSEIIDRLAGIHVTGEKERVKIL